MTGERMRTKSRATTRRKGRVASKMPKIEFDKKAIDEIKRRKKSLSSKVHEGIKERKVS